MIDLKTLREFASCGEAVNHNVVLELLDMLEAAQKDAARYQWIKSKRSLTLETCPQTWIREDGSKYYQSSHYLASDSSLHASMETLDLTIDAAMQS